MCTLVLSEMGELRDDWLRPAKPRPAAMAEAVAEADTGQATVDDVAAGTEIPALESAA